MLVAWCAFGLLVGPVDCAGVVSDGPGEWSGAAVTRYDWADAVALDIGGLTDSEKRLWVTRLLTEMANQVGTCRRAVAVYDDPFRHRALSVGGDGPVWFCISERDHRCFVAGIGSRDAEAGARWLWAAQSALASLSEENEYDWSAVIGVHPDRRVPGRPLRLAGAASLGSVTLVPLATEVVESRRPMLIDATGPLRRWFPIRVDGTARVGGPMLAPAEAGRLLRTVCGVLSVAWREPLTMRVGPHFDNGDLGAYLARVMEPGQTDWSVEPYDVRVEPWMQTAMSTLLAEANDDLVDAVGAFADAEVLTPEFPSQACVSYVACIEAVGERLSTGRGSRQRFREALATVLFHEEADQLAAAYDNRCGTAHDGTVYGTQRAFGLSLPPNFLLADESSQFEGTLMALRKASCRLLIRELGGPEDWTLDADDMPRGLVAAVLG